MNVKMKIEMTADDFFNAYLVLNENNEGFIDKLANTPEKTSEGTNILGTLPAMGVEIVCLAFSVELYIKYLHYVVNGKVPKGHSILKLFKKLPEDIQREIFAHDSICQNPFITRGNILSVDSLSSSYSGFDGFIDHIKAISDGFTKWRYSYESISLHYDTSFAEALIKSIKSAASEVRKHSTV